MKLDRSERRWLWLLLAEYAIGAALVLWLSERVPEEDLAYTPTPLQYVFEEFAGSYDGQPDPPIQLINKKPTR